MGYKDIKEDKVGLQLGITNYLRISGLCIDNTLSVIPAGTKIEFMLTPFINTLESPSKNYFYLTTGYIANSKHYDIEAFKIAIDMEQPNDAVMTIKPL